MSVKNLKIVSGQTGTVVAAPETNVALAPPVTTDNPYYIHLQFTGDVGAEAYVNLADDVFNHSAHVVLPGQTKTIGPYQADTAPVGIKVVNNATNCTYAVDYTVIQSGGNERAPALISKSVIAVDTSDDAELYNDLRDYWDQFIYPEFSPSNTTCAVYVVLYAKAVTWISALPTGATTLGANSALICKSGESLVLGPYKRENMPTIYSPAFAGDGYYVSLDIVKRG